MIDLSRQKPFASGGNRLCYRHPERPDLCVKIMRTGRIDELRGRAPWYKSLVSDSHFDDNEREARGYAQRALRNAESGSIAWQHLPRWYGIQATSEGAGAVSQMILDEQGNPAINLQEYLEQNGLDEPISAALERFSDWLHQSRVLTKNLLPHNLAVQWEKSAEGDEKQPELYLIDGLGRASFLPLAELFEPANRRYIERRIRRMWKRIHWEVSDREISWKEAERH